MNGMVAIGEFLLLLATLRLIAWPMVTSASPTPSPTPSPAPMPDAAPRHDVGPARATPQAALPIASADPSRIVAAKGVAESTVPRPRVEVAGPGPQVPVAGPQVAGPGPGPAAPSASASAYVERLVELRKAELLGGACAACGQEVHTTDRFCRQCGAALAAADPGGES